MGDMLKKSYDKKNKKTKEKSELLKSLELLVKNIFK